jgi:hypothetical protein
VSNNAGLKYFVIEVETEALGFLVPKILHKGAEIIGIHLTRVTGDPAGKI